VRARVAAAAALLLGALPATPQGPGLWEQRPQLSIPRQEVAAAELDGRVYVAGGLVEGWAGTAIVERFDPSANAWTRIADLPTPLHHPGMAAVGGRVYAIGGYPGPFTPVAAVWAYDPGSNQWTARAPLPRPRGALAAVTIDGRIYAVGGVAQGVGVVGDLTVYDPAMDRWTPLPSMPTPREHLAAATTGGKLYVAGGRVPTNLPTLEAYDPGTNRWTRLRNMPTARGGNGAAALFGRVLVFGGEGTANFPQVEEYDPGTDTWRALTPMPTPLHGIYPAVLGDEVVIAGGGLVPGLLPTNRAFAFRYERPTTSCAVTPAVVPRPGSFTYAAGFTNPGRTRPVDLYLGYTWPPGLLALYRPDLSLEPFPAVTPSFANVLLPEGIALPSVPLVTHPAALLPPGSYSGFVVITALNALLDGRLDPGDLLASAAASFTVQ